MEKEKHPKLKKALRKIITILEVLFFMFLFGTIIVLIVLTVQHYNGIANTSNNTVTNSSNFSSIGDTIKDIATIFTCITASFSLLVASLVRREAAQNRKSDRELDINQRWFKNLIIDRHLNDSLLFFSECENLVDSLQDLVKKRESLSCQEYDAKCKSEIVSPFTTKYTSIQYGLVSDMSIIDEDNSNEIKTLFEKFQDDYTSEIEKIAPNYNKMKNYVYDTRQQLLSILKQFDLSYTPK